MWKLIVKLLTPEHNEEKVHREISVLSSLKEKDGSVTSSQSDILRVSKSFYTRLYDTKPPETAASQSFLSSLTEVLDNSTKESLDQLISLDELSKAFESLGKNKSPRSDSLLAVLYSALWDLIGQDLLYASGQPFAESIRKDVSLRRVTISDSGGLQVKASLYMDDITIFCSDLLSVHTLMSICDHLNWPRDPKENEARMRPMFFRNWADQIFIPFAVRADYLEVL
eukprot:g29486.t1